MTFPDLESLFVKPTDTLRVAMDRIQANAIRTDGRGTVLVVNESRRLLGVLTDGDIRRALLQGLTLEDAVSKAMSSSPITAKPGATRHQLLRLFDRGIRHLPIVDEEGHVLDLLLYSQLVVTPRNGPVVVRAKVPLRISFAGGGSDFAEHFEQHGGSVISVTIDRYCHGILIKRDDKKIVLHSYDYGLRVDADDPSGLRYDGKLDLIKAIVKILKPSYGFELYTYSDVPPGSGLGASAVMAVAVIGLFNELGENRMDEYQISDLAYQVERIELGITGGWQDQYAASFGGFNFIEFGDKDIVVHPLRLKERVIDELESNLLLCFTGTTRNSGDIHALNRNEAGPTSGVMEARYQASQVALRIKNALMRGSLDQFGRLLEEAWRLKRQFGPAITSGRVEEIYEGALRAGALGGKLLGAGCGGHILFYCPGVKRQAVREALERMGCQTLHFNFDFRGARVWHSTMDET